MYMVRVLYRSYAFCLYDTGILAVRLYTNSVGGLLNENLLCTILWNPGVAFICVMVGARLAYPYYSGIGADAG